MTHNYDITIIGGGLAGGLMAIAASAHGFSTAIIDRAAFTDQSANNAEIKDGRTTFLAYATLRLFRRLGLGDILDMHGQVVTDMLVRDSDRPNMTRPTHLAEEFLHFGAADTNQDSTQILGVMIENHILLRAIKNLIHEDHNITIHAPAFYKDLQQHAGHTALRITQHGTSQELTTKLVIAADGRDSMLRERAQIRTQSRQYDQMALACNIAHENTHDGIAQQIFFPEGPLAVLPLTENRSSIVWSTKSSKAQAMMALDSKDFMTHLSNHIGAYLGDISLIGQRWSYPLGLQIADKFYDERLAIIGDAAHVIHPIAGQGYNLTIKDIAALVDVLIEQRAAGLDIGHGTALQKYDKWRRFDVTSTGYGTDMLNRLFSNDRAPMRGLRRFGMGAINQISPLKKILTKTSGGEMGDLPSLLQ